MENKAINLYRGGNAEMTPNFCCVGSHQFNDQAPTQIAAEYALGSFTYSFPIAPGDMRWQRKAFQAVKGGLEVGDFIAVLRVPEKHRIHGVSLELAKDDPAFEGWEVNLEMRIFKDGELQETKECSEEDIALAEKDGKEVFFYTEDFDGILNAGEHAVIGVVIKAVGEAEEPVEGEEDCLRTFNGRLHVTTDVDRFTSGVAVL